MTADIHRNKGFRGRVISFIILVLLSLQSTSEIYPQYTVISPGIIIAGKGGIIAIKNNVINNGSFLNTNDLIVFNGATQTIEGLAPVDFNNLTINAGSTTTAGTAGQTIRGILLSNGSLNAGGNFTLLSTADGTALIDGSGTGTVSGNITMQRYLPSGLGYKYFSSPFQAATVSEFGDDMDLAASFPSFYKYDENRSASGWVSYTLPANLLYPLTGYSVDFGASSNPNTVGVTGTVNNGNLSVTLYNQNHIVTRGMNLVGNPYPSPIDWNAPTGWTKTNIDNALYFFNASSADQYGGTYSTFLNGVSSDGTTTNIIPSMQGFFIHVSDGAWPVTGTLGLNNNIRVTDMIHSFLKSAVKGIKPIIRFVAGYANDSISYDPFVIYYDENATNNFDGQLDALKLFNTDMNVTNFYVFGDDGSRLSINAIPSSVDSIRTLRLGLKTEKNGEVTFKIRDIDETFLQKTIYLTDLIAGTNRVLLPDNQYIVYLPAGDYQNRFFLNISDILTHVPEFVVYNDMFKVYSTHGILKADFNLSSQGSGILTICNLTGQILFNKEINASGHYEFNPSVKDGIYIVSFISRNRRVSKKLFIQNQ